MLRYLNMFLIIGVALVFISLAGFATHDHFLAEPGQAPNGNLSLIYLGAALIMIVNGIVSNRLAHVTQAGEASSTTKATDQTENGSNGSDGSNVTQETSTSVAN